MCSWLYHLWVEMYILAWETRLDLLRVVGFDGVASRFISCYTLNLYQVCSSNQILFNEYWFVNKSCFTQVLLVLSFPGFTEIDLHICLLGLNLISGGWAFHYINGSIPNEGGNYQDRTPCSLSYFIDSEIHNWVNTPKTRWRKSRYTSPSQTAHKNQSVHHTKQRSCQFSKE